MAVANTCGYDKVTVLKDAAALREYFTEKQMRHIRAMLLVGTEGGNLETALVDHPELNDRIRDMEKAVSLCWAALCDTPMSNVEAAPEKKAKKEKVVKDPADKKIPVPVQLQALFAANPIQYVADLHAAGIHPGTLKTQLSKLRASGKMVTVLLKDEAGKLFYQLGA